MAASLIKLLEQSILSEGRVEQVLKKYQGKISPETVDQFVDAQNRIDPAINNKYLDWMANAYVQGSKSDQIISAIEKWHKNLAKIDGNLVANVWEDFLTNKEHARIHMSPRDISSYKNVSDLTQMANAAEQKQSKTEEDQIIKDETRLVYEDEHYQIRVPLTHRASCKYGRGTAWCTRLPDNDRHYKSYTNTGILFYITDKKMPSRESHPMYKVAVLMSKDNGTTQIFNARDKQMTHELEYFFPPEMIEAMKNYRQKSIIDLSKMSKEVTSALIGQKAEVDGWVMAGKGAPFFINGEYNIELNVDLKRKITTFRLKITGNDKQLADYDMQIPEAHIKAIEDIIIENNSDPKLIQEWIQQLLKMIIATMPAVLKHFAGVITSIEGWKMVAAQINKYTGNWKFKSESIPTDTNRKIIFKTTRKVKDPATKSDITYTLLVTLDLTKNQFVLGAEEDQGNGNKEEYEDQIFPFDKKLINDTKKLTITFLEWVQGIVTDIYDEDWQTRESAEDNKKLKTVAGNYSSPASGDFKVEVDADNKIHVYSDKTGGHYLIQNYQSFVDKIVTKYGLKKKK